MIQAIGLMIGMYIIVRMFSFLTRKGDRAESGFVQILAGIAIILTLLIIVFLLIQGTEFYKNLSGMPDIFK
jgi:ABC-type phosphate transport system permease subunit